MIETWGLTLTDMNSQITCSLCLLFCNKQATKSLICLRYALSLLLTHQVLEIDLGVYPPCAALLVDFTLTHTH